MTTTSCVTPAVGQIQTQHSSSGSTQLTNYARIGHAAQQLLPEILQDLISIKEPTALLHSDVTKNLFLSRTLRQHEWNLISNVNVNGYDNFDVPLIYKLVRNLNLVIKPTQGWDKNPPQQSEITAGDDVERIRRVRNEIFHRGNSSVSATELAQYFNSFRDIAGRLEIYLGKSVGDFVNNFNVLENCCMDEETEKTYIKRLDDLVRREKDVSEKLDNMEEEINVMRDSVTDIKTKGETHEIVFKRENEEVKRTTTYIQEEKTLLESKQLELQQVFKQKTTELESKSSYLTEQMSKITTDIKDVNTERKDVTDVVEKLQLEQINIGTNIKEMKLKMESPSISISDFETTIEEISKMFENIEKKHQTIILEVEKLYALLHDSIQPHIKVQIKNQIEIWKTKDEKFVSTRAVDYVMKSLQEKSCVTLTGSAGVGKTFIARHVALILQTEGYMIIPVLQPRDIREYYQPGKHTVFIVDDLCGNFVASQQQIEKWQQLMPVVNMIIADKSCKIIVSCRLQIFKDIRFKSLSPFKESECNLISSFHCLTSEEKVSIAEIYIGTNAEQIDEISLQCDFFPLLCSLYHEQDGVNINNFFKNPFKVYKGHLDDLYTQGVDGRQKICSLALCVIFNNKLKEQWFQGKSKKDQLSILEDTCDACGLNRATSKKELKEAMDTLIDTFVCLQNNIYSTLHDKLFDFLGQFFCREMPECLIEHGDINFVHTRFVWNSTLDKKNNEFLTNIPDDLLELYLERFQNDWSSGNVGTLFECSNMRKSVFRQDLIDYLTQLSRSQQVKLANTQDTMVCKEDPGLGNTPLISSCFFGYFDMVQWLLNRDVDVDQCRNDYFTPLIFTCQEGHIDILKILLEKNPNVNFQNKNGVTPLFMACMNGKQDIVTMLLEKKADINLCPTTGSSPLLFACQEGYLEIVNLLLANAPDVNLRNHNGMSPLLMACQNGHQDIVVTLMTVQPNINLSNKYNITPLFAACYKGYTDIVNILLANNPDVNLCSSNGETPIFTACANGYQDIVTALLQKNPDVNMCNEDGISPLFWACQRNDEAVVTKLLEMEPDINLCSEDGETPLFLACENENSAIAMKLLEKNPDVNKFNDDMDNPLIMACYNSQIEIVCALLEKNADLNVCDRMGATPLLWACENNDIDIVVKLLEKNPDVNLCTKDGLSPLMTACNFNRIDLFRLIMKHNPDIDTQMVNGDNPLLTAIYKGYTEITEILLTKGANSCKCLYNKQSIIKLLLDHPWTTLEKIQTNWYVDVIEHGSENFVRRVKQTTPEYVFDLFAGSYPLHLASFIGHIEIIKLLLKHKVNIDIQKEDGTTALFYACEFGHEEIVRILLDSGSNKTMSRHDTKSPLEIAMDNGHQYIVLMLQTE